MAIYTEYEYTQSEQELLDLLDAYYYNAQVEQHYYDKGIKVPERIQATGLRIYDSLLEKYGIKTALDPRKRHDGQENKHA